MNIVAELGAEHRGSLLREVHHDDSAHARKSDWSSSIARNDCPLGSLAPLTTYYWHVRARERRRIRYRRQRDVVVHHARRLQRIWKGDARRTALTGVPVTNVTIGWGSERRAGAVPLLCHDCQRNLLVAGGRPGRPTTRHACPGSPLGRPTTGRYRRGTPAGPTCANGGTWWTFTIRSRPGAFGKIGPRGWVDGAGDESDARLGGQRRSHELRVLHRHDERRGVRVVDERRHGHQRDAERPGPVDAALLAGARGEREPGRRWPTSAGGGALGGFRVSAGGARTRAKLRGDGARPVGARPLRPGHAAGLAVQRGQCGRTTTPAAWRPTAPASCWGDDDERTGPPVCRRAPFAHISAGINTAAACAADGGSSAGDNDPDRAAPPAPGAVHGGQRRERGHTCGIGADGIVACWGATAAGRRPHRPGRSPGRAGYAHTCGVTERRRRQCWGDNSSGEATPRRRAAPSLR